MACINLWIAGGTWARILGKILTYDFAIHPFDSNIIYAAGYFADKGRVVKTTDGGKSWEEVYSEAAVSVSVRSVALNPSQPNQVIIGNSAGSVAKSNDGGITWKLIKISKTGLTGFIGRTGKCMCW